MDREKVMSGLGLAKRAGKIASGEASVLDKIRNKRTQLVFLANDASSNTSKSIKDKCLYYHVMLNTDFSNEELNKSIGTLNHMVVAVTDRNFRDMIMKYINC